MQRWSNTRGVFLWELGRWRWCIHRQELCECSVQVLRAKHLYRAGKCSMIEASVYKRHGITQIESTAGDVSHCSYSQGSYKLRDGSVIIWSPSSAEVCEYTPWFKVKGTLYGSHFVSGERDMVLTFNEYGYDSHNDCKNRNISRSDQGLMVRFETPPIKVTISEEIN